MFDTSPPDYHANVRSIRAADQSSCPLRTFARSAYPKSYISQFVDGREEVTIGSDASSLPRQAVVLFAEPNRNNADGRGLLVRPRLRSGCDSSALRLLSDCLVRARAGVHGLCGLRPIRRQSQWGFIRITLCMGPFGFLLYVLADKEPRPGEHEKFTAPYGRPYGALKTDIDDTIQLQEWLKREGLTCRTTSQLAARPSLQSITSK